MHKLCLEWPINIKGLQRRKVIDIIENTPHNVILGDKLTKEIGFYKGWLVLELFIRHRKKVDRQIAKMHEERLKPTE